MRVIGTELPIFGGAGSAVQGLSMRRLQFRLRAFQSASAGEAPRHGYVYDGRHHRQCCTTYENCDESLDASPTYFFGAQGFGGAHGFAAFFAAGAPSVSLGEDAVLRNVSCSVLV